MNTGNAQSGDQWSINHAKDATDDQIASIMDFHPWDDEKITKGKKVREALGGALKAIIDNVPPSPDRSTAIRKLRECRMDCNSAITFNGRL